MCVSECSNRIQSIDMLQGRTLGKKVSKVSRKRLRTSGGTSIRFLRVDDVLNLCPGLSLTSVVNWQWLASLSVRSLSSTERCARLTSFTHESLEASDRLGHVDIFTGPHRNLSNYKG